MAYSRYTKEQIEQADSTNLVDWLKNHGEEVKKNGTVHLWEKNQVWIDGCKWYSHYEQTGGYAISFLQKYYGKSFVQAMKTLIGNPDPNQIAIPKEMLAAKPKQELEIPPRADTMKRLYAYLIQNRCIDKEIVNHFVRSKQLYEDDKHNCVFVGHDEQGQVKHIYKRGTNTYTSPFKGSVPGNDFKHCFHHNGTDDVLYIFEAPIDMLAFITLHPENWQQHSYVALCGVSEQAMLERLRQNPKLKRIGLCLDNDDPGAVADAKLSQKLQSMGYSTIRILRPKHKDWDEDLQAMHGKLPPKEPTAAPIAQASKTPTDFSLN